MTEEEVLQWAQRSLDFAFECDAAVAALIPTRLGNGAMEALDFTQPSIAMLEDSVEYGLNLRRGRVFADLWDLERFSRCEVCFEARLARLQRINLYQTILPGVQCGACQ
jgi:hypothetical protein